MVARHRKRRPAFADVGPMNGTTEPIALLGQQNGKTHFRQFSGGSDARRPTANDQNVRLNHGGAPAGMAWRHSGAHRPWLA
jgi:hypothetical protein